MADESKQSMPAAVAEPESYVVGIGASSGGLSALQTLLSSLPPDPGFACVIVMHLSPEHESHLPELLQTHSPIPVQQVKSTVALERNRVYVIPPNANLNTIDTHLRLSELEERRNERAPIDHFLRTLAATHDGTAIGVILTGAGSDGSRGLRHIKECGGLAIAQDPEEAAFDSMPRSAIATGMVDLVLPLQRISEEILKFCQTQPELPVPDANDAVEARDEALLGQILGELRRQTNHDFAVYTRSTLLRRLRRRMQLRHVTSFAAYLAVLSQQLEEAEAFANDLLLMPMEFFRDPVTFQQLESKLIPQIFARKGGGRERLRIWSVGCSTGEEAYSLAMLLLEERARRSSAAHVQVFATDAAERVLAMARDGIYPREIAASVSAERLERFFNKQPGFFRVKRELQEAVLFASHDLFNDPPFGHVDLIVCQGLLSDLQPEVRRGLLNLFHYALESEGMLLVGPHDEINTPDLFLPVDGPARLYRRRGAHKRPPALPASMRPFGPDGVRGTVADTGSLTSAITALHRSIMEPYALPSVLIDTQNRAVHYSSNAGRFIHIPGGELTQDLTRLVREPIRSTLLEGLQIVRGQERRWNSEALSVPMEGGWYRVVLRIENIAQAGLTLVVFDDRESSTVLQPRGANVLGDLDAGLKSLDARLQDAFTAQADDDEAQRAKMQAAAMELQSVLEELATSREELQAVNEELVSLDDENRRRVHELTQVSNDLEHLLAATGIATLFLDDQLRIVRFTPALGDLFGLRMTDIGRPISDMSRLWLYREFTAELQKSLSDSERIDRELQLADGRWFLVRALPYKTASGATQGAVLTLVDISERKRTELAAAEASRQKDDFLAMLAHELRNPLAPISAGIEVLRAAPGDRRVVERMVGTMARQTQQLVRLVDDLLEVSRISGGKLRLQKSTVELHQVLQDAIASVRPALESAGHALNLYFTDEPMRVEGDAARLTQVVSNLLSNAVRYTPRSGVISMFAAREGESAVITVKDNGVGIAPEALEHVFEMFYQGSGTRRDSGAGLGVGLTLAKSLIEMHGGTIDVHSAGEGSGSQFTIRLPLTQSDARAEQPSSAKANYKPNGGDHRILIVDDNVDAAETLCLLMKSLGEREVHTAISGEQALQAAPALHPDIVLLDLMMPEMDGYEVARRIRLQPWGKDVCLVALSGLGQEHHRRRSMEAGFDRHVTKPADLTVLQAVLNDCSHRV